MHIPYDAAIKAKRGGGITCACWASCQASEILTGHDDGSVILWSTAPNSRPRIRAVYSVADAGTDPVSSGLVCAPVTSIHALLGEDPCAVVKGGGNADAPEGITLLRLQPGPDNASSMHVPWFGRIQGFSLVRPPGSFQIDDSPTAVITLTEGGYMCIFDVSSSTSEPFAPDFQARPVEVVAVIQVCYPPCLHLFLQSECSFLPAKLTAFVLPHRSISQLLAWRQMTLDSVTLPVPMDASGLRKSYLRMCCERSTTRRVLMLAPNFLGANKDC
jgi:hypothetical protein